MKIGFRIFLVFLITSMMTSCLSNTKSCSAEIVKWITGTTHPGGVYATEIRVGKTGTGRVLGGKVPPVHAKEASSSQTSFFTDLPPIISADWLLLPEKTERSAEFNTSNVLPECAEPKTRYKIMITFSSENKLNVQIETSPIN